MTDDFQFKNEDDVIKIYFKNTKLECGFAIKALNDMVKINRIPYESLSSIILFHVLSLNYNEYKSIDNLKSIYEEELKIKLNNFIDEQFYYEFMRLNHDKFCEF